LLLHSALLFFVEFGVINITVAAAGQQHDEDDGVVLEQ
jgi:hypothetical protein